MMMLSIDLKQHKNGMSTIPIKKDFMELLLNFQDIFSKAKSQKQFLFMRMSGGILYAI